MQKYSISLNIMLHARHTDNFLLFDVSRRYSRMLWSCPVAEGKKNPKNHQLELRNFFKAEKEHSRLDLHF